MATMTRIQTTAFELPTYRLTRTKKDQEGPNHYTASDDTMSLCGIKDQRRATKDEQERGRGTCWDCVCEKEDQEAS